MLLAKLIDRRMKKINQSIFMQNKKKDEAVHFFKQPYCKIQNLMNSFEISESNWAFENENKLNYANRLNGYETLAPFYSMCVCVYFLWYRD